MSARTGVPFSTLSKVEHDRLTLSYDKLQQISERLGIRMSELFSEPDNTSKPSANSRRSVGTLNTALQISTPQYDYYYMSPELRDKDMIPMISRLKATSLEEFGELSRHAGEEYVYALGGRVIVHTEFYAPIELSPGESVYLDSEMGHAYVDGGGSEQAVILTVCSATQETLFQELKDPAVKVEAAPPDLASLASHIGANATVRLTPPKRKGPAQRKSRA
jgi:transcriptional regulator with XRE-family HTH domain